MGRFAEPARLVLAALQGGPRGVAALLDDVRRLDGPVGPGTLFAAIARLERRGAIESVVADGQRGYRLRGRSLGSPPAPGGVRP
jgi:DNA-binding PadR family transcriptional regulator